MLFSAVILTGPITNILFKQSKKGNEYVEFFIDKVKCISMGQGVIQTMKDFINTQDMVMCSGYLNINTFQGKSFLSGITINRIDKLDISHPNYQAKQKPIEQPQPQENDVEWFEELKNE